MKLLVGGKDVDQDIAAINKKGLVGSVRTIVRALGAVCLLGLW